MPILQCGFTRSYLILTFFETNWFTNFKTVIDLESLGIFLYIGYPLILIKVGLLLWIVMIGVISLSM